MTERLVDIYTGAEALTDLGAGVEAATIRQWVKRGHLAGHGYDHRGRLLVDAGELYAHATRTDLERVQRAPAAGRVSQLRHATHALGRRRSVVQVRS